MGDSDADGEAWKSGIGTWRFGLASRKSIYYVPSMNPHLISESQDCWLLNDEIIDFLACTEGIVQRG